MITITESKRKYCTGCFVRDLDKSYEIRFGDPKVSNVSVMVVCDVCLMQIKQQIGEVNLSE